MVFKFRCPAKMALCDVMDLMLLVSKLSEEIMQAI